MVGVFRVRHSKLRTPSRRRYEIHRRMLKAEPVWCRVINFNNPPRIFRHWHGARTTRGGLRARTSNAAGDEKDERIMPVYRGAAH